MKIAILGPYPPDGEMNNIHGGVQAVVVNMIKGFLKFKDLEIHVVTTVGDISEESDFVSEGISVHAVSIDKRFGNITGYIRTRRKICRKIQDIAPDIVHSHGLSYYTLAGMDSGCKNLVVSTHGLPDVIWRRKTGLVGNIRSIMQYRAYLKCLRGCRHVIANSPYAIDNISGTNGFKIHRVDNPVSDIFFNDSERPEEEKSILFAGNMCSAKGIMTMLDAIDKLRAREKGAMLRLAGPVTEKSFYKKAAKRIKEKGLGPSVSFLGHLSDEELKKEYDRASVFIFPSYQDVAPVALLQAMAAGKAIVASDVGGIKYMIEDGVNGFLIKPGDYEGLARKIFLLIKDGDLRKSFGMKARQKALENNSISISAGKLCSIYKEIMANSE